MRYKFSEIAENSVAKRVPAEDDKQNYIGLEHLISGSLAIPAWGSEVALKGEKLIMKKGDVLFGKRNTYLRRVGIAPHDGLFSAHGMILRPKSSIVDAMYFPFFINSDKFFNEAIKISVGSLSPTVNWKDLKELEFDLPPIERQRELANLLWAANDLKESYKKAITATDEMLKAKFREMFGDGDDTSRGDAEERSEGSHGDTKARGFPLTPICEIGIIFTGSTPSMSNKSYYDSNDICFVKPSDLSYDITNIVSSEFYISREAEKVARMFSPGAVLVTCIGATIGKLGVAKIHGTCNQQINVIVPNKDKVETLYIAYSMLALQPQLMRTAASTTVPIMNKREFSKLTIPLPPLSLQREFVAIAEKADAAKSALKKSIADIDQVMKGLINQ